MSIRPVDIVKTQDVTQLKLMENQRAQHLQEQAGRNFQSMIEHEHRKPKETTSSDNPEYRYDAKNKGNNEYQGSKGKKREKKEDEKDDKMGIRKPPFGGFDVRI